MKIFFLCIAVLALFASNLFSQPLGPAYIVQFTDKAGSPYSIANPGEFLTPAALDRRALQNIPVDVTDIPVNSTYLQAVAAAGAQIATVSRWFNNAAVWITDPAVVPVIAALPFVASIVPMGGTVVSTGEEICILHKFPFKEEGITNTINIKSSSPYGAAFNQINMVSGIALHDQGYQGNGIAIAVLDAGFRNTNLLTVFANLWAEDRVLGWRDFVQPGNDIFSPHIHPHGTNVLSIMAADQSGEMIGTAPEASYWLLRTEDVVAEYLMEEHFWVAGAEFADSVGAWIINSSLGYTEYDNPAHSHTYASMDGNTTFVTRGADKAATKGILVVASAGNQGQSPWQFIGAPADGDSVFTIGAVDAQGFYAFFSSKGPSYDGRIKPDVTAQGLGTTIASSAGGITAGSGTSFSSPIIAGMAACLWQTNLNATNMQVAQAIISSSSQYQNPDTLLGFGIPDFQLAQITLTALNDSAENNYAFEVFPNPTMGSLYIKNNLQGEFITEIAVYSAEGSLMKRTSFNQTSLVVEIDEFRMFPAGVYIIIIKTQNRSEALKVIRG